MSNEVKPIKGDNATIAAAPTSALNPAEVQVLTMGRGWSNGTFITPGQARELAAQLMSAADAADAQNAEKMKVA